MIEKENKTDPQSLSYTGQQPARRMRPPNQTAEEKKAWNEEIRLIKNAKAREAQARKKAEKENNAIRISSSGSSPLVSPSSASSSLVSPPPASSPIFSPPASSPSAPPPSSPS